MERYALLVVVLLSVVPAAGQSSTKQSRPSRPASSTISKITNSDVVQLVAAGLSAQVIITAIHQAPGRDFDLSPAGLVALKKAGVSDTLILAMQGGDTPAKPASQSNAVGPAQTPPSSTPPVVESVDGFYWRERKPGDKPPYGDYILLSAGGNYQLVEVGSPGGHFRGTYKIEGSVITLLAEPSFDNLRMKPSGDKAQESVFAPAQNPPLNKHFRGNSVAPTRISPGKIIEPDGTVWEKAPESAQAEPTKPVSPSPIPQPPAAAPTPCAGVEMMGLYKNEIFDRAMGGGVVEWLAKIRNNTSVTKIVVFGWIDSYGQQQRSQVQIRGGDIASPRVDMTQARYIAPVRDVRLLSCE